MTRYLVDTNVLLRAADSASAQQAEAEGAMAALAGRGDELFVAPQVLMEFWSVVTRPIEANGLGWTVEQAQHKFIELLSRFLLLEEKPSVLGEWLRLVVARRVTGKKAHDTHLVALMNVHAFKHLLTFNTRDFDGYDITAVSPDDLRGIA